MEIQKKAIEIERSASYYGLWAITCNIFTIGILYELQSSLDDYSKFHQVIICSLFILITLYPNIYLWYCVVGKETVLIINEEGIIYKKEIIYWWDIKSYLEIYDSEVRNSRIIITGKNKERMIIDLSQLDIKVSALRNYIEEYSTNDWIIDEGTIKV